MDCIIEFVINYYILVFVFLVLWGVFFVIEFCCGGKVIMLQFVINLVNQKDVVIVDVCVVDEFCEGYISGSVNIFQSQVMDWMGELEKYKDKLFILICKMGNQVVYLGCQLCNKGFFEFYCIQGGVIVWCNDNLLVFKG